MATIKAIEARSVHQIQSGQVIVDLNSVIKELVENSLDAGATSIEVRFKNNGLDLIEVQDNGSGISPENYDNVALKHYTSKLSSYDDLLALQTFGFRGEALSSLCALSTFHITTAQAKEAPRATRLEFEQSGKLKSTSVVAGQKGTTASVESLFKKLPVRRRELEKNIKREYGKVLNLLHAYACVSTGVRFSARNTQAKKTAVVFTTNGNASTRENIANVYGAKTLLALIPLELELEFESSGPGPARRKTGEDVNRIQVRGYISRPVFGEGRQTPDRQMFFVNSRPCALPQIAKAFNEVYKSFNVAQSPFVFADFHMDTNAYDVNVSPDKRTILLHDAGQLIESLKAELKRLFEEADQTVPQSQVMGRTASIVRQRSLPESSRTLTKPTEGRGSDEKDEGEGEEQSQNPQDRMKSLLGDIQTRVVQAEPEPEPELSLQSEDQSPAVPASQTSNAPPDTQETQQPQDPESDDELFVNQNKPDSNTNTQITDQDVDRSTQSTQEHSQDIETPNTIQNAFDRMRPRRVPAEMATITIGDRTVTSMVGSGIPRKRNISVSTPHPSSGSGSGSARKRRIHTPSRPGVFGRMQDFAAPGSQTVDGDEEGEEEEEDEIEDAGSDEAEEEEEIEDEQNGAQAVEGEDEDEDMEEESQLSDDTANRFEERESESEQSDEDMTDEAKKKHEDAEVQRLIKAAEKATKEENQASSLGRANKLNKGVSHRDSTVNLTTTINCSFPRIQSQAEHLYHGRRTAQSTQDEDENDEGLSQVEPEERLSLTVTKDDFARMRILGQFNLGFILASRSPSNPSNSKSTQAKAQDELFIIDQHASDEKINFERLQATTTVQNQRLVHPKRLDLTAVEEEIVIENLPALEKNGFVVDVDDSGDEPIGKRCSLLSLPLSREVVFDVRDLEELIVLLSESTSTTNTYQDNGDNVPRPSKVRKMFAMRACRSSIMIGKTLTVKQMQRVVRDMGEIDKPWNCPHGRPTMRHLFSLGSWEGWNEYDELDIQGGGGEDEGGDRLNVWRDFVMEHEQE
ncbi:hypothetical protein BDV18DRAFT_41666 [Aspergillus unguis]